MGSRKYLLSLLNVGIYMLGMNLLKLSTNTKYKVKRMKLKKKRKKPEYRISSYLMERNVKGIFATEFDLLRNFPELFYKRFHISVALFDELYDTLEPHLVPKRNTRPLDGIPPKAKLASVLEYLATDDLQCNLALSYRLSEQHFGRIIERVCSAICIVLRGEIPEFTEKTMLESASNFQKYYNLPNCIGIADIMHILVKTPPRKDIIAHNMTKYHSIALLAICDAEYKIIDIDVRRCDDEDDIQIFKNSRFVFNFVNDGACFPPDVAIAGKYVPYFIVGGNPFPLCRRIMKPYNCKTQISQYEQIFNDRLQNAHRCIEITFNILFMKWQCLRKQLSKPDRGQTVITACCLLHNYFMNKDRARYCPSNANDFKNMPDVYTRCERNLINNEEILTDYGKYVRDVLKQYFTSEIGLVSLKMFE